MNKTTLNSQKEKHSTLSLRRATRYAVNQFPVTLISIHALLAESDEKRDAAMKEKLKFLSTLSLRRATVTSAGAIFSINISIHALLAESDHRPAKSGLGRPIFLSTLSLRRATHDEAVFSVKHRHFYPRSPCGERRNKEESSCRSSSISIHALLAESDFFNAHCSQCFDYFYPRSPCGERRLMLCPLHHQRHFYPRSPCGERRFKL